MRILFDHCTPAPLRRYLTSHVVDTAAERGWHRLRNGALLNIAEENGYELLITTDQSIRHQQNLSRRTIAILLILDNSWPRIQSHIGAIVAAMSQVQPGQLSTVPIAARS